MTRHELRVNCQGLKSCTKRWVSFPLRTFAFKKFEEHDAYVHKQLTRKVLDRSSRSHSYSPIPPPLQLTLKGHMHNQNVQCTVF